MFIYRILLLSLYMCVRVYAPVAHPHQHIQIVNILFLVFINLSVELNRLFECSIELTVDCADRNYTYVRCFRASCTVYLIIARKKKTPQL